MGQLFDNVQGTIRNQGGTLPQVIRLKGTAIDESSVIDFVQNVTYSASMTFDPANGSWVRITATNGVAFTINAPTNPVAGQRITLTIRNTSGGALGAVTFNAVFKLSAWTQPANGFSRSIEFLFDGTNWVQVNQTGVDVAN